MTAGEALHDAAARLAAAGIAAPRHEARLLLTLALGVPSDQLIAGPERELPPADSEHFEGLIQRRLRHEPYSRIAGKREFWSLEFALGPETLDPRPDSETVIETALALVPDRDQPIDIIDFGTGSGALLLALLSELPRASGIGVDRLPGAAAVARRNAAALGLAGRARFVAGDWGQSLALKAHLILANPPYICSEEIARLAPEVAGFDPRAALDGGPDGLAAYRALAGDAFRLLRPAGVAVFEIGAGQDESVVAIMSRAGLELVTKQRDLAGVVRSLAFVKRKNSDQTMKLSVMK